MKIKVKAITTVMHGRHHLQAGDEMELTKGEADELQKAGLVQVVNEQEEGAQPAEAGAQDDDMSDLLGDGKMDAAPQNKMMPPARTKRDPEAEEVERQVDTTVNAYVEAQAEQQSIVSGAETPEYAPAADEQDDSKPAAGRSGKKAPAKKAD